MRLGLHIEGGHLMDSTDSPILCYRSKRQCLAGCAALHIEADHGDLICYCLALSDTVAVGTLGEGKKKVDK